MARKPANLTVSKKLYGKWLERIQDGEKRVKDLREKTKPYRIAFHEEFPTPMPDSESGEQVTVSRVHRMAEQWNGAMYAQNPQIFLEAPWSTSTVNEKTVALNAAILNTELNRCQLEKAIRPSLQTATLDGWAWVKSGFHAEFEESAEDIENLSTDAFAEQQGFELGQEFWPTEVLVGEPHEEHLDEHKRFLDQTQAKLQATSEGFQSISQQVMKDGMEQGFAPEQIQQILMQNTEAIQKEIQRLTEMVQGITDHLALHEKMQRERDQKGLNLTNLSIRAENCWTSRVHNTNVVWDQLATGPDDWRWVAERFIKPLPEVKKLFPNDEDLTADFAGPRPGSTGEGEDEYHGSSAGRAVKSSFLDSGSYDGDDDPDALCSYWKVWDIEHRRVIYIHEPKESGPLSVKAWPHKFMKSAPLQMLFFEQEEDSFAPISPIKHFFPQQLELNRYRSKASIITRRNNIVAIADPRVPDAFIESVKNGEDCSIVKLTTPGVKPREAIHNIEWGAVPVDVWNMAGATDNDIETASGMSEAVMGGSVKAKTATAAEMQKMGSSIPLDLKLRALENFIIRIATDLRNLMRQYYKAERWQTLFWEGSKVTEMWRGSDLLDFDIKVEMGSSRRQDKDVAIMQWKEATEVAMSIEEADTLFCYRRYLRALGVRDTDEAMISQPAQQVQQAMAGPGKGQGQGQQSAPGKVPGPQGAAQAQPAMDLTK